MIKRYTWNWIVLGIITVIVGLVMWMCVSNLIIATDSRGLRIVSVVEDGTRSIFTLDCGASILQFKAVNTMGLVAGDYIPAFDEFKNQIDASITATVIFMCVVGVFYLGEVFMVPSLLRKVLSKRGTQRTGEVESFKRVFACFYTPIVEVQGTKSPTKLILTKRECEKLGEGHGVTVWNGGGKYKWVEFVKDM